MDKRPDCFGWADGYNPSCKRCTLFTECMEQQASTRPRCFGNADLYDPTSVNCSKCLDQSFCIEKIGGEMTVQIKRPAMTLRPGNKVAPKVARQVEVEEPEEQIEDLEIEEVIEEKPAPKAVVAVRPASNFDDISDSEYFQTSIVDLREMAEKRGLDPTGRKSDVIRRLIQADANGDVAPAKKEEETLQKPGEVKRLVVEPATWASEMLERLRRGETLHILRTDEGYAVQLEVGSKMKMYKDLSKPSVVNQERVSEVERNKACFTEEYYTLRYVDAGFNGKSWNTMSHEEKREYAAQLEVVYEPNANVPIEAMRILDVIRKHLGIEMYRPEYQKKSQRVAAGYW